ncbi:hypothetical protein [Salinithrix halophila]|uniref:Uncharacterized protein n=1 Tax=Salinithrix halophila TaxID=1485204 RepID=A0ABV8JJ00_9BACL
MSPIILITGNVTYQINLDPTIWIVDERRFDMGSRFPGIDGLGISFAPFLANAEPAPDATQVILHRRGKETVTLTMAEAKEAIFQFAREGKPIHPDGPALLFLADGSNRDQPIDFIEKIEVV